MTIHVTGQDRAPELPTEEPGPEKRLSLPGPDGRPLPAGVPDSPAQTILRPHTAATAQPDSTGAPGPPILESGDPRKNFGTTRRRGAASEESEPMDHPSGARAEVVDPDANRTPLRQPRNP
ncbi:glyoxalase [Streptomyces yangpuensis]|uniref:glyoxalase n=1 Tax=Streptomyces yangpuensis TaxID=1648182 RepID=UPI0039947413